MTRMNQTILNEVARLIHMGAVIMEVIYCAIAFSWQLAHPKVAG